MKPRGAPTRKDRTVSSRDDALISGLPELVAAYERFVVDWRNLLADYCEDTTPGSRDARRRRRVPPTVVRNYLHQDIDPEPLIALVLAAERLPPDHPVQKRARWQAYAETWAKKPPKPRKRSDDREQAGDDEIPGHRKVIGADGLVRATGGVGREPGRNGKRKQHTTTVRTLHRRGN